MKKISVCVPTYNRPDTLRQLINSYQRQDYKNKELVISDDTPNDSIKNLVEEIGDKTIKYFQNSPSLRFAKNFHASMARATGDFVITFGDDDVLLNPHVLSQYVEVFEKYPDVAFVYSNQVQFSDRMDIQYIINFVNKSTYYKKGEQAMKHIWMRALFIGGLGVRNRKKILNFFPERKTLYPQVEFAGHILNNYDGYILKGNNIGFRSHDDQIIFRALKDKDLQQEGDHTTVEFFDIFKRLKTQYKLKLSSDFLAKELINLQFVVMFKEKKHLGREGLDYNYNKFRELSAVVKNSKKLMLGYYIAKYVPTNIMTFARNTAFTFFSYRNSDAFKMYKEQLETMTRD